MYPHAIYDIDGLVQERCNSIANTLELRLFALTHWYEYYFNDLATLANSSSLATPEVAKMTTFGAAHWQTHYEDLTFSSMKHDVHNESQFSSPVAYFTKEVKPSLIKPPLKFNGGLVNLLRAKFLRENINIYLHLMSFLRTNKTQVVEILPRVRQGPAYST